MITELNTGLITGEQKRILECYIDARFFRQRKSYDEYYLDVDIIGTDFTVSDLMILAEEFDVRVESNRIALGGKR